jgi:hypothetical protein
MPPAWAARTATAYPGGPGAEASVRTGAAAAQPATAGRSGLPGRYNPLEGWDGELFWPHADQCEQLARSTL